MLFDPNEHEPLRGRPWDDSSARDFIRSLCEEAEAAYSERLLWPEHPMDADWSPGTPLQSLFWGASGVAWALAFLKDSGMIEGLSRDYPQVLGHVLRSYRENPDTEKPAPGFLMGEAGILYASFRFERQPSTADSLHEALRKSIARPELELMWAAPGAIVIAGRMAEWTGEERWVAVAREAAKHLVSTWKSEGADPRLWTQDLYGSTRKYLGALHGLAGNGFALMKALPHLGPLDRSLILEQLSETLLQTAAVEEDLANWAPVFGDEREKWMIQWCHGAPGMITSFAPFPREHSDELDNVLLQAGKLVWRAGPLRKPFGLCHGTAGNAYAFLALFDRTGDGIWLDRARAFAMHALEQSESQRAIVGCRRYALLTGDLGLALCLWSCIAEDARFPLLELI
jgi:hypothetical protein